MDLKNFSNYHVWAGNRIRKLLETVSEEEFEKDLGEEFSHPSLRKMIFHTIMAVKYCLAVVNNDTENFNVEWEKIKKLPMKELLDQWQEFDVQYAEKLPVDTNDTTRVIYFGENDFDVPKLDFLLQYITHTIYHRGQIIIGLKKLGKQVIGTDYLFYLEELYSKK
ncbi:MAG: hypothetical protein FK734_02865 [Asgard group archaeon]|nr:hypothetical protein [Asgard group archaeon]